MRKLILFTLYSSLFTLTGCKMSLSPVKNKLGVGVESYVFFDADGEDGQGDIYAGSANGGTIFRVTFSRAHESSPALSPDGVMLAFIRGPRATDSAGHRVWIMNLLSGAERKLTAAGATAFPVKLGWSIDGRTLFIRTTAGDFQTAAPPSSAQLTPVSAGSRRAADTALSVSLGDPVIAIAVPCEGGIGICAVSSSSGKSQLLSESGRNALRWGADSVGYFIGNGLEIRPLGGGNTRELHWAGTPPNPRTATQFPGGPGPATQGEPGGLIPPRQ
jgi:hypothetical protein